MSQGTTKGVPIDTDGTLSANQDVLVPSQKAVKTYVDDTALPVAGGTMAGDTNSADNEVQRPVLADYCVKHQSKGSISGAQSIDVALGNSVSATATGAITWAFSNPSPTGNLCPIFFRLTNGGAGAQTWPASVDWEGGTAPTLTASGTDVLMFLTSDAGTLWDGFLCSLDSK